MGKKKTHGQNPKPQNENLLSTLGDFTSKENWDKFFTIRGSDDSFEWYAEWPHLKTPLLSLLRSSTPSSESERSLQILIPGCGNSRLSEHLYDAGFHGITNIDFSKVVISDMLRRNVRDRPDMRWRVMDMTQMQFADGTFDVVLDKGGLDALMEPEFGPNLGNQYLSEVKRVLNEGGKFICLTLAESHVLGLLFPKFRFGWEMTLHCISQKPSSKPSLSTFMVVAVKGSSAVVDQIMSSFDHSSIDCNREQAHGLYIALEAENNIRKGYLDGSDIIYSLEDLKLGAKGDLIELIPGRRVQLTLGGQGDSTFCYRAVLLDAGPQSAPFLYNCGIFLVPKTRAHEWLFSSEEGQWMVVESSKAARLIMILLDSSHASVSMSEIQKDLSPLVKQLAPEKHDSESQIPFMMAGDGIKHRKLVHQATSRFTGPIIVEDVMYENVDDRLASMFPSMELIFRRLTFQRAEGLVQSEALLMKRTSLTDEDESVRKKLASSSKSKKKQKSKQCQQPKIIEKDDKVEVDHTFLASSYHAGIIAGFTLVSSYLDSMGSGGRKVEAVVIGLGAGLLPMFLHNHIQFLQMEVVELDPVVVGIAKEFFGFYEDERLKVHVADGIKFLQNLASSSQVVGTDIGEETTSHRIFTSNRNCVASSAIQPPMRKLDILIVDVDSSDSSSGLSCPAPDFVEDHFLTTVKDVLSEQGLFVTNLVSRSSSIKEKVISRIKSVFGHLFCLQLEEDVNEVLFAMKSDTCFEENISQAVAELEKILQFEHPERIQSILKTAEKIKRLK
uniref:Methyltransferase type 11 domain-containing protein n=1 Tax=Opuntia streptacantha TaxID=393608 RepID=A0A7C9A2R3_OPUST